MLPPPVVFMTSGVVPKMPPSRKTLFCVVLVLAMSSVPPPAPTMNCVCQTRKALAAVVAWRYVPAASVRGVGTSSPAVPVVESMPPEVTSVGEAKPVVSWSTSVPPVTVVGPP